MPVRACVFSYFELDDLTRLMDAIAGSGMPAGISGPFYLPRSHDAWEPVATAESYAETRQCNRYAYRFGGLQLADDDGSWGTMRRAETLQDPGWRLRRHGASSFSATGA